MHDFSHVSPDWHVEQFLQRVFDRSGSYKSMKVYADTLNLFFSTFPGKVPADVTKADCAAFVALPSRSRRNYGNQVSIGTRNSRLMVMNSLLKWLQEQDVTLPDGSTAPAYDKPLPTRGLHYGQQARPYRSMDQREVTAFFNAIDQESVKGKRDYCIMLFAFMLCRRREELARMTWGDISEATFIEDGQERRGHCVRYVGIGHAREVRTQELPGSCMRALISYLNAANRLDSIKASDPLFTNVKNSMGHKHHNEKICADWLNGLFHDIARRAGLPVERLSFHSLRHAGALARSECGSTVFEIQRVLGHAQPEITFRYLSYIAPSGDSGARKLEARLPFLAQ